MKKAQWRLRSIVTIATCYPVAIALGLALFAPRASAFSLLCKPCEDCPETRYGFQPDDIGVAANLGEEYRWNVPMVVYTFDASFVDYFGISGIAAVESAISILNGLPPASQINPSNFPPEAAQMNFQAASLGLLDLKSMTLALLLEQLGLAQPTRHVADLRDWDAHTSLVVQRNFDPFTTTPSYLVNGILYNWMLVISGTTDPEPEFADAVEFPMDPLLPTFTAVADRGLTPGQFYTGLTRDDAGGLRYLLRTNNVNLETLLPGLHGIGTNAGAYAITAPRPGVDKLTFVRRDYDSFLGQFFSPFTNQFTDTYVTNNEVKRQWLERVVTEPDIVFTVGAPPAGQSSGPGFSRTGTSNWWNSASVLGLPGTAGPGVIRPQVKITFHPFTPTVFTSDDSPAGTAQFISYRWGSFDGSTNPPVAYPAGATPGNEPLIVKLVLHPQDDPAATIEYVWQLPVPFGGSVALEMSSDLQTWTQHGIFTNLGSPMEWNHTRSQARKFYRVVPQ